jgi:hypothetical protein
MRLFLVLAQTVRVRPDPNLLPGAGRWQELLGGAAFGALLVCVLGLLAGGALIGVGSLSDNPRMAARGQKSVIGSLIGAVLIGSLSFLVNWAYRHGISG